MIVFLAFAVTFGFKQEVAKQVYGIGGHIRISAYQIHENQEATAMDMNDSIVQYAVNQSFVKEIYPFVNKLGLLKTDFYNQGVNFKGVENSGYFHFLKNKIIEGKIPTFDNNIYSNEILLSKTMAVKLELKLNEKIIVYFIDNNMPRLRQFVISGIFQTGISQFDESFILGDIKTLQALNSWKQSEVDGLEVFVNTNDVDKIATYARQINEKLPYECYAIPITSIYYDIFNWLDLMDMNAFIVLLVISIVASISIMSIFIINIIEKKQHISLFKALGMPKNTLKLIFSAETFILTLFGMIIGNFIATAICLLQDKFHFLKLDSNVYYVDYVPITIDWNMFLIVNIALIVVSILAILIQRFTIDKVVSSKKYD
ncbi:ABC transporter permease [Bacteroidia bacterium]|nr:ABC transporter permease [Bacteroidia bacterium]